MGERRKSRGGLVVILLAGGMLLLVLYVVGYFWLGELNISNGDKNRFYRYPLSARLYYPAALVEAQVTRQTIILFSANDSTWTSIDVIKVDP